MYPPYPPKKRLGFTASAMILLGQLTVASQASTAQLEEIVITAALMKADINHLSVTSVT
jgi:hypothetical protein